MCSIYVEQRREKVKKGSSSLKTYAEVLNQKEKHEPTGREVAGEKALVQVFTKAGKMLREVDSKKGCYKTRK